MFTQFYTLVDFDDGRFSRIAFIAVSLKKNTFDCFPDQNQSTTSVLILPLSSSNEKLFFLFSKDKNCESCVINFFFFLFQIGVSISAAGN